MLLGLNLAKNRLKRALLLLSLTYFANAKAANIKVAAISYSPSEDAPINTPQANVDRYKEKTASELENLIRQAASCGARLIVTPEFGTVGYPDIPGIPPEQQEFRNRAEIKPFVETVAGKTVQRFGRLAVALKIWLTIGIAEVDPTDDKYYNTLVAFSPHGAVVQTYRKINLFEGENDFLSPGSTRKYFTTEFGRVGMFTCSDIHYANPARDLVERDAVKIIAFSTSWVGKGGMRVFKRFAQQNKVYFLAANHIYFPDSGVISPNGAEQSHTQRVGVTYGTLDLN